MTRKYDFVKDQYTWENSEGEVALTISGKLMRAEKLQISFVIQDGMAYPRISDRHGNELKSTIDELYARTFRMGH